VSNSSCSNLWTSGTTCFKIPIDVEKPEDLWTIIHKKKKKIQDGVARIPHAWGKQFEKGYWTLRIWRLNFSVINKQTPWPQSASELYRPSDRRLYAKLVPTFADRGCRVVSATDPHGRFLGFLDRSHYYFFQAAPHLYSGGWVDPVPDPLLVRKSGSARNRTRDLRICSQKLWPLDHRGGHFPVIITDKLKKK
jgi:hypothetical protein